MNGAKGIPGGEGIEIGVLHGCRLAVLAANLLFGGADFVIAAFAVGEPPLSGGSLAALDRSLGGALDRLRIDQIFRSGLCETMLLSSPPAPILADAILMLGLGAVGGRLGSSLNRAARCGTEHAIRLRSRRMAILPATMVPSTATVPSRSELNAMLSGIGDALKETGSAPSNIMFMVEPEDLGDAAERFQAAFASLP